LFPRSLSRRLDHESSRTRLAHAPSANMLAMMHPFVPALFDANVADALHEATLYSVSVEQPRFNEHDDSFTVAARAVGVRAQDMNITLEGSVLKLLGETKTAEHTHVVNFHVSLPDNFERVADIEASTASCQDGRVTVTFPKREAPDEEMPSVVKIDVKTDADIEPEDNAEASDTNVRSPKNYRITLSACGIRAVDLKITVVGRTLKVEGETKRTGAMVRHSFMLPRDADIDHARASHVDGFLTVMMPKKAQLAIPVVQAAEADSSPEESKWQSEWDGLLEDLAEMGFCEEVANRAALTKHAGSIKLAVRELIGLRKQVLA